MTKEDERSVQKRPEANFYLPVRSEKGGVERGTLPFMMAKIAKELGALDEIRGDIDLPEEIRYLRNVQDGILVMIARRRPFSISYRGSKVVNEDSHTWGFFAEAFQEIGGVPQPRLDNISGVWNGIYERVDVSDETARTDSSLVPTNFDSTKRSLLRSGYPTIFYELPGAAPLLSQGQEGSEKHEIPDASNKQLMPAIKPDEPIIAGLFEMANTQEKQMRNTGESLTQTIYGKFRTSNQGLSNEVGLANLIITDGDSQDIADLSTKLGLNPLKIESWKMTRFVGAFMRQMIRKGGKASEVFPLDKMKDPEIYYSNTLGAIKEATGVFPLVVTVDTRFLSDVVHSRDIDEARKNLLVTLRDDSRKYPLFAVVEINAKSEDDSSRLVRTEPGKYTFNGKNISDLQALLVKVGVDYALTKQMRGLAGLVKSL